MTDVEDLGYLIFEDLCYDYLTYNPFLSEAMVLDHCCVDRETYKVVMLVNEIGKTPYKITLETKIISCEKGETKCMN